MKASLTSVVAAAPVSAGFAPTNASPIRVLAFMEATWLTGPAKNLIEFAGRVVHPRPGLPSAEVTIATFDRSGAVTNCFVEACRQAGIKVHVIRERFTFDPAIVPEMRRLILAEDPDIVQTHNVKSHFLMWLTGGSRHARWIAFQHGYTWPDFKMRLYNQLDRLSLPGAHQVVTVCQTFALALERVGVARERIVVQHNSVQPFAPVPAETVLRLRRSLGIPDGAVVLVSVGRLSREKGHTDLVAAFGRLSKEKTRSLRLVLVGDGPERPTLHETARELGIADCVIFAGQQADVNPFYQMADIVVLPSHTEGSPNVLLEAMAAGRAIVATNVGGVPEVAADGKQALLVNRNDPGGLSRATAKLINSERLRQQLATRARIRAADFSPEEHCCSLLNLYQRLLTEAPRCTRRVPCA